MLNAIKIQGAWQGIEYNHQGPAHLSIGQEAAASASAPASSRTTTSSAPTAATARSWPSACPPSRKLPERELAAASWSGFLGRRHPASRREGRPRQACARPGRGLPPLRHPGRDLRPQGRLQPGPGRLHARLLPARSALCPTTPSSAARPTSPSARRSSSASTGKPGIVIANIGDASMGCGPVWEAMLLRDHGPVPHALGRRTSAAAPPILFNFINNFYGMGGQTDGETMGFEVLARVGAGVNPEQMHAERVDGYNPLAVVDAIERKKKILLEGRGPGPAGHRHLPHLRPLPLRRLQLPRPRRRSSCGRHADSDRQLRRLPGRAQGRRARRAGGGPRSRGRAAHRGGASSPPATPSSPARRRAGSSSR